MQSNKLIITTGEPAGIGMDIVLDLLAHDELTMPVMIVADARALTERAQILMTHGVLPYVPRFDTLDSDAIDGEWADDKMVDDVLNNLSHPLIIDTPCATPVVAGQLNINNTTMVERQLAIAHHLAGTGRVSAIVTTPIQKSVLIEADIRLSNGDKFSGHTEYFMQKCGCDKVVMMLANAKMRVALVTTHLPLRDVPDAITPDAVARTVQITYDGLQRQFGIAKPKLLVCGVNPHAGEDGHLGQEERDVINPILQNFIDKGMDISLAMPADTLFTKRYLDHCDAVIAMYHDQGLAPLKSHGFGDTVNITLGLPYLRTSVDHGTALDLAGTGKASSTSLLRAIQLACKMNIR